MCKKIHFYFNLFGCKFAKLNTAEVFCYVNYGPSIITYVLDNGKISYGMLQARNGKICPGFDQVYEKIEKSMPNSRYLGYDANLQRF